MGRTDAGLLRNAMVVEDSILDTALISVKKLTSEGYTVTFANDYASIMKDGVLKWKIPCIDDQYLMDITAMTGEGASGLESVIPQAFWARNAEPEDRITLWHQRLGHRNRQHLIGLVKRGRLGNVTFPSTTKQAEAAVELCEACSCNKSTVRNAKKSKHVRLEAGRSISSDLKGPMEVPGDDGQRYYQGVLDEGSRYLTSFFLHNKSEALQSLKDILAKPEYQDLVRYHVDGAPELLSASIQEMLKAKVIRLTFSNPYKAVGNSHIERSHRTIFESATAMLYDSGLAQRFWCDAVSHAVDVYNTIPTMTSKGFMSPLECLTGREPDYDRLKVFGSYCYANVPAPL